ncbi:MAG: transcriptional repressor [Proteobacteria bacterium]|nr:transcriptional repressor [Cystobacterineae bacterium]MCL2258213.1 transcriptional repressor [Cystobacterineae bacterium]MCL2315443.1 transcriptional repressor [Pseudomonadota bacterium]
MGNFEHKDFLKGNSAQEAVLREAIRKVGLRVTSARLAVMQVLTGTRAPVSHAELVVALEGCEFDRATLYRNLMDLTEAGLLERIDLGDHIWRFELRALEREAPRQKGKRRQKASGGNSHPHFACVDCGQVSCLPEVTFKAKAAFKVPKALSEQRVSVQIRGQCDDCSQ